jgi:AraC-like DNA-binding protein
MSEYHFTVGNLLSIVTCFAGLLYAFQIGTLRQKSSVGRKYFTGYLIVLSLIVLLFFLIDIKTNAAPEAKASPLARYYTLLIVLGLIPSIQLLPPLMWLYIRGLISYKPVKKAYVHFLPAIVSGSLIVLIGIGLFLATEKSTKALLLEALKYICIFFMVALFFLQNLFYIVKSIKGYIQHKAKVKEIYSYSENVDLSWVKIFISGYLVFVLGMIVVNLLDGDWSNMLFSGTILCYVLYTGHNAMRQRNIKLVDLLPENELPSDDIKEKSISEAQSLVFIKIKSDLLERMADEKPYLDQNLSIFMLAKMLSTNSKYLSQVINVEFGKSFVHFINEYRIEDAKKILLSENNYTIEAQSQMAGFKSKSSFNTAFKRHTGTTPSLFIQNQK